MQQWLLLLSYFGNKSAVDDMVPVKLEVDLCLKLVLCSDAQTTKHTQSSGGCFS